MSAALRQVFSRVNVIDFTVTAQGLETKLLGRVVQHERLELEEQRQKLDEEVIYARAAWICVVKLSPRL